MPVAADLVAIDTSVAIALTVATHPAHDIARQWSRGRRVALAGHAAVETFSVLTRLPGDLRVDPATAQRVMESRFDAPLILSDATQRDAVMLLAAAGIAGGAVYDGLVALAAREHDVALATRDARARGTYERMGVAVTVIA